MGRKQTWSGLKFASVGRATEEEGVTWIQTLSEDEHFEPHIGTPVPVQYREHEPPRLNGGSLRLTGDYG